MRWVLLIMSPVFLLSSPTVLRGQVEPQPDSVASTLPHPFDTLSTGKIDTLSRTYVPRKSAGTALLLSAILPGAGQVYNESYWKAPIVAGFGVYFVSEWLHNNRLYKEWRDKFTESLATTEGGNQSYLAVREFYKDQRDSFTWYFFILYIVNLADAYVDASLFDFDVGSSLSIRVQPMVPVPAPAAVSLGIRVDF